MVEARDGGRRRRSGGGGAASSSSSLSLSLLRSVRTRRSRVGCECTLVDGPTRSRRPGRLGYVPSDRDGSRGINNWMGTLPFGFSRTDPHGHCNTHVEPLCVEDP